MTIFKEIDRLIAYAVKTELIQKEDIIFIRNQILHLLQIDYYEGEGSLEEVSVEDLESILKNIVDYAVDKKLTQGDGSTSRDLFDTALMGLFVDRPSSVTARFFQLMKEDSRKATDYFYKLSQDCDYIRRYRIKKDLKWQVDTEYGALDITINLSKPEKDPKAIAQARNAASLSYPQCLLCKENVGYAGRLNHAPRENLRIIPLELAGERWYFQYSPYVYYNEHCIVFNEKHTPMKICEKTFQRLLDFVTLFPHYTLGSNADLPIVGGSILTHDHFQGGAYEFPMARAPLEKTFKVRGFEDVESGIIKWPMSVIRLSSPDPEKIVSLSTHILDRWRSYSDEDAFIFSETQGEKHNTITPIARKRGDRFEMDLVLRNNITTKEHPLGVFHPHGELHHIKKENIGLIEVMGLAVLPSRLKTELKDLGRALVEGRDISRDSVLSKHENWGKEIKKKYDHIDESNVEEILRQETGLVFSKVLAHAGVYKRDEEGQKAFLRFVESL